VCVCVWEQPAAGGGERSGRREMRAREGCIVVGRCRQASIRRGRHDRANERTRGQTGQEGISDCNTSTSSTEFPPPILARPRRPQGSSLQQVRRRPVSQCPGHQGKDPRIQGSKVARARCRHVTTSAPASNSSRAVSCLSVVTASPSPSPASSRRDSWAPSPVRSTPPELPRDCTAHHPLRRLVVSVAARESVQGDQASRLAART
jgi:hypothetical protein